MGKRLAALQNSTEWTTYLVSRWSCRTIKTLFTTFTLKKLNDERNTYLFQNTILILYVLSLLISKRHIYLLILFVLEVFRKKLPHCGKYNISLVVKCLRISFAIKLNSMNNLRFQYNIGQSVKVCGIVRKKLDFYWWCISITN